MRIDVVFWDLGGVFTSSPVTGLSMLATELGVSSDELWELVFGPYHRDTDHQWHRLERGETTLVETMAALTDEASSRGWGLDASSIFAAMGGGSDGETRKARSLATLHRLSGLGVRHGMITNNIRELADRWVTLLDMTQFDAVIDSSAVGLRKPNPAIFELAMERLGVTDPSRAAFVDDVESNVAAAAALGLHGVVAGDDIDAAMTALEALV